MNEQEFENLWQEAVMQGKSHRMALQYPQWERRMRRVRNSVLAVLVVGVMSATTLSFLLPSTPDEYYAVYTNRASVDDTQWVSLASEMLTIDII